MDSLKYVWVSLTCRGIGVWPTYFSRSIIDSVQYEAYIWFIYLPDYNLGLI
jgi:hypothetical protein